MLAVQSLVISASDSSATINEQDVLDVRRELQQSISSFDPAGETAALLGRLESAVTELATASVVTRRDLMHFIELRTLMNSLLDEQIQVAVTSELVASGERADVASRRSVRISFALLITYLLFGVVATFLIGRTIRRSVDALAAGVGAMAQGDLKHRVKATADDEFGSLASELNRMAAQLGVSRERLQYLAHFDALTGLVNRAHFFERLEGAMNRVDRGVEPLALLYMDLDGFKGANDQMGHASGDLLLKLVAERLRTAVRKVDTVARLGGDEFAVVLEGGGAEGAAEVTVRKVLGALAARYVLTNGAAEIGASVGIARYPKDGSRPEELVRKADAAMYAAKAGGRNRFVVYDASLHDPDLSG